MKVLFVWDSDYPWDIRVEKICNTLLENGWKVHLVCRNRLRRPTEEIYNGIHIHRLPFLPRFMGSLNEAFSFPAFFSPLWLSRMNVVAKDYGVDLVIVRDLPMALTAVLVAKFQRIPVIFDMAEVYPELIRNKWKFEPFEVQNVFFRNPLIVDFVEHLVVRRVDHIFAMVEESLNRLIEKGVSPDKITIVSNTPIPGRFETAEATFPGLLRENKGKLLMLYVGFFNFSRGLDTALVSLKEFTERNNNRVYLTLLGNGSAENYLKEMVRKLGLESHVGFAGWVDNKFVPEYVASSDICLVPHHKCGHWDHTIPNKLFDYMAAGKPVLVSDVKPMKRIVEQANCGLVYKDGDSGCFVSQLEKLQDRGLRIELGKNGARAVKKHYNWVNDSNRMLNSIRRVLNKGVKIEQSED